MKPKAFWLDCKWSLQSIDLADSSLARSSASAITQLGMAILINEQNPYSNIVNSKERFLRAFSCLFRHHQHAIPPILLRQEDGFLVMDGNHRIAAYFYTQALMMKNNQNRLPPLKYWVAETNDP